MKNNLANESLVKTFIRYVSLNVLSMISFSLYILADTYFIANSIGSNGLTALNIALPIFAVMNGVGYLVGVGSATLFSIFKGENNYKKANIIFTHGVALGATIGMLFTLFGLLFAEQICSVCGADEIILPIASGYIRILLLISPAFILNNIFLNFIRNDNAPKLTTIAMITSSLSNIIFDYILVVPLNMGIEGAAIATAISPIISMCILSTHIFRKKNTFKFVKCKVDFQSAGKLCAIGFPSYITEVANGIVMFVLNFIILSYSGNTGVAAFGIIANFSIVAIYIFNGIALGVQPIISLNYGAKNYKNIRKAFILALCTAIGIGLIIYLSGLLFAENIVSIFNSENNTTLAEIAVNGIHIYFSAFIIAGLNIVIISYFASIAKPIQSFIISISRGLVFVILFAIILSNFFELNGVWFSIPVAETATLLIGIGLIVFKNNIFKNKL